MPDAAPPPQSPPALDRDLYCLTCGYNLRGLAGDPVRCPECGNLNAVGDVAPPSTFITAQIRRMDDDLSMSIVALLIAAPLLAAFWTKLIAGRSGAIGWGVPAFVLLAYWLAGCVHFRRTCRAQPGWLRALVMYHLWSLFQVVAVAAFVAVLAYSVFALGDVLRTTWARIAWALVLLLSLLLPLVTLIRWSNARARAPLNQFQRNFAVTAAREEYRRYLTEQQHSP